MSLCLFVCLFVRFIKVYLFVRVPREILVPHFERYRFFKVNNNWANLLLAVVLRSAMTWPQSVLRLNVDKIGKYFMVGQHQILK